MSKKVNRESKVSRYVKAPIRILIKARDLYVKSMTEYSERISFGTVMGCPTGQVNGLSRSYSVGTTNSRNGDDDLRELIRAASTRSLRNKARLDRRYPRIDEDKPCGFEGEDHIKLKAGFPRSRSCAVTKKKTVFS